MSKNLFEITHKGIKLSYVRYLSDTSIGLIILLIIIIAYYSSLPFPVFGKSWIKSIASIRSTQVKIFILIISFFLATPLGLIINALSWFCLGWTQNSFFDVWLKLFENKVLGFFIRPTIICNHYKEIRRIFIGCKPQDISEGNFLYSIASYFEGIFRENLLEFNVEHIVGASRLVRNVSFLFLILLIYLLISYRILDLIIFFFLGFIFSLFLLSLIEFFRCTQILFQSYLFLRELKINSPCDLYELGDLLKERILKDKKIMLTSRST